MVDIIPMVKEALNSFSTTNGAITIMQSASTAKITLAQFLPFDI